MFSSNDNLAVVCLSDILACFGRENSVSSVIATSSRASASALATVIRLIALLVLLISCRNVWIHACLYCRAKRPNARLPGCARRRYRQVPNRTIATMSAWSVIARPTHSRSNCVLWSPGESKRPQCPIWNGTMTWASGVGDVSTRDTRRKGK